MKFITSFFLLLAICIANISAFADFNQSADESKCYVEAGTICVTKEGIFLNIDGEFFPVPSVHADSEGVYLDAEELSADAHFSWVCCHCNRRTSFVRQTCPTCGHQHCPSCSR